MADRRPPATRWEGEDFRTRAGLWLWLLALSLQLPALRSLARYVFPFASGLGLAVLLAAVLIAAVELYRRSLGFRRAIPASPWVFFAAVAVMMIAVAVVYPIADGLKTELRGSDSDDALIVAGERLAAGRNPYLGRTYFGLPLSPGPGWVVLWMPWTLAGVHFLATPLLILAAGLGLRRALAAWWPVYLFFFALASSLGAWEIMAVGGDQLAIGLAILILVLAAADLRSTPGTVAVALAAGIVATARVSFGYFPAVLGGLIAARDRRRGLLAGVVGTAVCGALHLGFYAWGPGDYSPFHLLAKGGGLLGSPAGAAALGTAGAGALAIMANARRGGLAGWLLAAWASLALPLSVVAAADLVVVNFRFRDWEGASYLLPPMPIFAAYFVALVAARDGRDGSPGFDSDEDGDQDEEEGR